MGASFWLNDKALWIAKPCHCQYYTIAFALFSVALTFSTHIYMSFVAVSAVLSCIFIIFFNFGQYLIRGAQFSEAGLNGALTKRKKQHKKQ